MHGPAWFALRALTAARMLGGITVAAAGTTGLPPVARNLGIFEPVRREPRQ